MHSFKWASLGSALSRGPWGTDAQNSTVAMPWLRSRSKKVAEMVMESHWVPRKKRSQEHRRGDGVGEQGGAGVWTAGRTEPGRDSRKAEEGAADRRHRWGSGSGGTRQAGPRPAHLSLPFWMEAWPRLALSRSGGIPASVCAGGEDAVLWGKKGKSHITEKTKVVTNPVPFSPFYHEQWREAWAGRKDVALTLGGRVFYSKHKWPRREGQGSQRKPGLVKEGAPWRGLAPQQEGRVGPGREGGAGQGGEGRGSPRRAWGGLLPLQARQGAGRHLGCAAGLPS